VQNNGCDVGEERRMLWRGKVEVEAGNPRTLKPLSVLPPCNAESFVGAEANKADVTVHPESGETNANGPAVGGRIISTHPSKTSRPGHATHPLLRKCLLGP
jgi:hypothetical protein